MSTERQVDLELILVFIEQAEALDHYLRDSLNRLEYALFVVLNRSDELDPQYATRPPAQAPFPRAPSFPILPGDIPNRDIMHARLLVGLLRLVATMREAREVFGSFERATVSVQQEMSEAHGQQPEDGGRGAGTE